MTDTEQPDDGTAEVGPEGWPPFAPATESVTASTAALSSVIKEMQRGLAPPLRVPIPAIPASVFAPLRIQLPPLAGLQAFHRRLAEIIEPVLDAQREQIAKILLGFATALEGLLPENWRGLTGLTFKRLEGILLDEGIPLVGIPRRATVQAILDAPDAAARRVMIGRRWRSIATDCETVLRSFQRQDLRGHVSYAVKAISALRDGHPEAAQALAANLLDTLLRTTHFAAHFKTITNNKLNGKHLELDDYTVRFACAIAPVWSAYRQFWTSNGDPVPKTFARHASAHAVSKAQYSRTNAVVSIMLVTSLLWLCEHDRP